METSHQGLCKEYLKQKEGWRDGRKGGRKEDGREGLSEGGSPHGVRKEVRVVTSSRGCTGHRNRANSNLPMEVPLFYHPSVLRHKLKDQISKNFKLAKAEPQAQRTRTFWV
jgi:hypothetical protein